VEVQRLRIMGQRRDQQIVGLGDGPVRLGANGVAQRPLGEIAAGHQAPFSVRTSRLASVTWAPSLTLSSVTMPSNGAVRLCSIFIASRVSSFWPLATATPFTASTEITRPGIGDKMS